MNLNFFHPLDLKPTEHHKQDSIPYLLNKIIHDGVWTKPILVHKHTLAILDGHHRREVALRLRLKLVPCLLCCYDDDNIELGAWNDKITPQRADVFRAANTGQLLPYKTTRHFVPDSGVEFVIPLGLLKADGAFAGQVGAASAS